jgi:hypothetical protein
MYLDIPCADPHLDELRCASNFIASHSVVCAQVNPISLGLFILTTHAVTLSGHHIWPVMPDEANECSCSFCFTTSRVLY